MAIRGLKKGVCAAMVWIAVFVLAARAGASTICNDTGSPVATNSNVDDNILVPSGATCTLNNVTVTGNVTVESGGCLIAGESAGGAIIGGNVTATGAKCLAIGYTSSIGGSVTALGTTSSPTGGQNYICATTIGGNVTIDSSGTGASWCIGSKSGFPCQCAKPNTIIGSLIFDNNKGTTKSYIADNSIGSNLTCSGNANLSGSGNTATHKQGQCAGF
jgi:hypothetical protein